MPRLIRFLIVPILAVFASPILRVSADACLYAPASMFGVGDSVIVAPGITRLNMRFLPAVGTGIVAALGQGYSVEVIAGPSCNGLYTWWRVETAFGVSGWVAEGTWSQYWLIPAEMPAEVESEKPPTPFEWTCVLHFDSFRCL